MIFFDITRPLEEGIPVFPGDPLFEIERVSEYPSVSRFCVGTHTGTHVDAPAHLGLGTGVDRIPLESLCGPADVVEEFENEDSGRLLFKGLDFHLDREQARRLIAKNVRLIGVEGLSIEDGLEAHAELLKAGVVILEGIDLAEVPSGRYQLCCLPLRILGGDGAPARAVLWKD